MASDGPIMKVLADPLRWHCGRRRIYGSVSQNPVLLYVMLELMPKVLYAPKVLVPPPVLKPDASSRSVYELHREGS